MRFIAVWILDCSPPGARAPKSLLRSGTEFPLFRPRVSRRRKRSSAARTQTHSESPAAAQPPGPTFFGGRARGHIRRFVRAAAREFICSKLFSVVLVQATISIKQICNGIRYLVPLTCKRIRTESILSSHYHHNYRPLVWRWYGYLSPDRKL